MKVEKGDTIKVDYSVSLEDGSIVEKTPKERPLEFVVGENQVIPGFDGAVLGMGLDEEKTFTLKPAEGFGERRDSLVKSIPKVLIPKDVVPTVGEKVMVEVEGGQAVPAVILEVSDEAVVLDVNHPLAGHDVTFDIKIVGIDKNEGREGG